jgi:Cu/Zn superoxide dismutase
MLKKLLRSLAAAILLAAPLAATADHLHAHLLLTAKLSGAQEVPAVTTNAQGVAGFTLNETRDTLFIQAAVSGLSGPITGVHIHDGAVGVAGPIITNLLPTLHGTRLSGFLTGADIVPAKLAKYLRGLYYINFHTAQNPGGEIRGQITVESDGAMVASLSGAQEVPAVTTPATGLGIFSLSQNQEKFRFRVVFTGLTAAITGTHFHQAALGSNGPVVVNLLPYLSGNVIEGEIVPTAAFLTALSQGQIYINVHTTNNTGGEIRSQLSSDSRYLAFDARLDGAQMVPASASTAKGVALGRLSATFDTIYVMVAHTGLSGAPTSLNLNFAEAGQANFPGGLLGSVVVLSGTGGNTVGNVTTFRITVPTLAPAVVNMLLRGSLNLTINTAANPNGEIRGQIYRLAREGYMLSLNGAQERPATTSTAYGVGVVSVDRDQSNAHFMSVWTGLSGLPTGAHFHTGLSTQNGPVVFNLVPFFDNATTPTAVYGYWKDDNVGQPFTRRRSLQYRADSMYMNIHTATNPGGEIRGQVYRGARNLQRILAAQPSVPSESFRAAPNPFAGSLTLSFEARTSTPGVLRVADMLGRTVASLPILARAGSNSVALALPQTRSGLYILTLEVGNTRLTTRIAKE